MGDPALLGRVVKAHVAARRRLFDSDGGFASEQWSRDGQRWVLEATGITRDGAEIAATNVVTRINHDSFNWQSVARRLNDVALPDTAIIKVTRVKTKR